MILKLKYPVLLLILSFLFGACEKEYSLEGNTVGASGAFTFTGAPGACASAVVTGTYTAGVALGADNTVTISVDVTTIGTYNLLTSTVNGISFSGTGSFTSTGVQTVTLAGTGIPTAAGTFSFTPGADGCAFPVIVAGAASAAVFTYDGGTGTCAFVESIALYTANAPASGQLSIDVNVTTPGTWSVSTPVVNGFSFSGTGNFTMTGLQKLFLTAAGTPLAAGVFNFTPTNGCSFPITVFTGNALTDSLVCKIDGVATSFNVDLFGEKVSADTFNISGNQLITAGSPSFGFTLTKTPDITTGNYDRYLVTNTSTFCLAGYSDGVAATPWFTGGLPTTDGFTVIITAYTSNRIEGTFSGTLFSDPLTGTGPKVITEGKFSLGY